MESDVENAAECQASCLFSEANADFSLVNNFNTERRREYLALERAICSKYVTCCSCIVDIARVVAHLSWAETSSAHVGQLATAVSAIEYNP